MTAIQLVALAGSFSLLSGWRLYCTVLVAGLAMRTGYIHLPDQLVMLDALASWWVIGAAGVGFVAEFFADKVAWVDSLWDGLHSIIRPLGGALLALAIVDPADPGWQIATFLLGGGAALLSHGVKTGARAVINTSPEPVSNAVVSVGEDASTFGLLGLALAFPVAAFIIALTMLVLSVLAMLWLRRVFRRIKDNAARGPAHMLGIAPTEETEATAE